MKLVNLGHAQSEETRIKIGAGVRMGWEKRRGKLMLQETCHFEWQNLIAEASRTGFVGEEELQWDSYETLDKQLEQEWLESVEQRKNMPRPKGSKRAPKSLEQRRKISEAISAKWADPGYRDRVCSALAKFHGIPVGGAERKPRRKPSGDGPPRIRAPVKKKVNDTDNFTANEIKIQNQRSRLKKSKIPPYKDPLASSKLEMIKNIRAQRAYAETKKNEAIERAKLLIAEAEKAAKALEVAATRSPLAQASLIETRKLIAEAIQSIESIETGQIDAHEDGGTSDCIENEKCDGNEVPSNTDYRKINGSQALEESYKSDDMDFLLNGKNQILKSFSGYSSLTGDEKFNHMGSVEYGLPLSELDSMLKQSSFTQRRGELQTNGNNTREKMPLLNGSKLQSRKKEIPSNSITKNKKWVRGKLVEMAEGE